MADLPRSRDEAYELMVIYEKSIAHMTSVEFDRLTNKEQRYVISHMAQMNRTVPMPPY